MYLMFSSVPKLYKSIAAFKNVRNKTKWPKFLGRPVCTVITMTV